MYKVGEYIVYKKDVCIIKEIKEKYYKDIDYYILEPINDKSLKISVPINSKFIRKLITKEKIKEIIKKIPSVEIINSHEKMLETKYKELLKTDNYLDLIKIIKTTYLRNKERLDNNKKVGEKDYNYFNLAEKYLYTEFSIILNMSYNETKEYIKKEVEKINKWSTNNKKI